MEVIRALNIKKSFGSFQALQGMDLSVSSGECVGLLGPNGAGKSTFINILYGACRRSFGDLSVFGIDPVVDARSIKKKLGVVPQENALDEALTVFENMSLFAKFKLVPLEKAATRIDDLLKYLSLDHKKTSAIRTLSGGMKRRLAFVRALLTDPELLVLDEPTTGLDPAVRHLIWQKVSELKKSGKTILITTHYMHEAEALCDRVVILNQGKIVDSGSPKQLIDKHTPGYVALYDGESKGEQLKSMLPSGWMLYKQRDAWCVRAPVLSELVEFQKTKSLTPVQMRPANLEDVYLKITGEELAQND